MKKPENKRDDLADIREKIIGLGEKSIRKSYYPELLEKLADLERFKTLLDQSNDAIFLVDVPSGKLLYVSRSACVQIGYPENECLALTMYDFLPEDAGKLDQILSDETDSIVFDAKLRKRSGEKPPYEINMRKVAFKNRNYVVAIARDITERKQTEEHLSNIRLSLERSLNFTRALLSAVPTPVFYKDSEGRYLGCNSAFTDVMGVTEDQIKGKTVEDLWPSEHAAEYHRKDLELMKNPKTQIYDFKVRDKNGVDRPVIYVKNVFRDENDKVAGIVGAFLDITERKQAEERLRESERKFRASFNQTFQYAGLMSSDGTILEVNQSALSIIGCTEHEVTGRLFWETPWWTHSRELQEKLRWAVREAAMGELVRYEVTHRKVDGNLIYVDFSIKPVKDEAGMVVMLISEGRDITDRKLAEIERERLLREIDRQRRRFQTILDSLPVSVFIVDSEGRIELTNPVMRNYWGGSVPRTLDELDKSGVLRAEKKPFKVEGSGLTQALRKGETTVNEVLEFEREKGVHFTMICYTAPLFDAMGNITGAVMICLDITEMRVLQQKLGKSESQAKLYLDLMSHDITNMNQALMGYLEMIEDMSKSGMIDQSLIENSIGIINRSSRLITDVKKLTRLLVDNVPLKDVDACKILAELRDRYSIASKRPVTIHFFPRSGCLVKAGDLLPDVFDNLVDNAIRHSTGPLTIDIAVEQVSLNESLYSRISVADNGPGIPDKLKRKIFSTLEEIGGKTERRGFGLYLVRTVVEYYNGHLLVEDRVSGDYTQGAKFVVLLQLAV